MDTNRPPELKEQEKIIKIIEIFYPKAKIYLFGSYARGDARRTSDIDIAIDNGEKIDFFDKAKIRNMIDALNLVQRVDIVDFRSVPEALRQNILKDGKLWKN